jgi:hypothetical protein
MAQAVTVNKGNGFHVAVRIGHGPIPKRMDMMCTILIRVFCIERSKRKHVDLSRSGRLSTAVASKRMYLYNSIP